MVTGASSGIGREIARELAARGCELVLAARRADRLDALATELRAAGATATCVACDLATPDGRRALLEAAHAGGAEVDVLVNNAGFGDFSEHARTPWDRHASLLQINVWAVAELTHAFVGRMLGRDRRGYVLNVASMVAYMPIPYFANYCGTKAYVVGYSESLAAELARTNVSVTCLSPGGTRTEFVEVAGQELPAVADRSLMPAARVARIAVRAMFKRKRAIIPGLSNKFFYLLTRLFPRRWFAAIVPKLMGKPATRS